MGSGLIVTTRTYKTPIRPPSARFQDLTGKLGMIDIHSPTWRGVATVMWYMWFIFGYHWILVSYFQLPSYFPISIKISDCTRHTYYTNSVSLNTNLAHQINKNVTRIFGQALELDVWTMYVRRHEKTLSYRLKKLHTGKYKTHSTYMWKYKQNTCHLVPNLKLSQQINL